MQTIMTEEWRPIKNYEDRYAVSSFGRVKVLPRKGSRIIVEIIMILENHYRGYKCIQLTNLNGRKKFFIHRLVGDAFLPNPDMLPVVNHKDLDKHNNNLSNLEWVSFSDNTRHYFYNKKVCNEPF